MATVEAFASADTRRLGPDRSALPPAELAGQVVTAFALVDGRDGADVAVRVFNPRRGATVHLARLPSSR